MDWKSRANELAAEVNKTMKALKDEAPEHANVLDASMAIVFRAITEQQMPDLSRLIAVGATPFVASKDSFNQH